MAFKSWSEELVINHEGKCYEQWKCCEAALPWRFVSSCRLIPVLLFIFPAAQSAKNIIGPAIWAVEITLNKACTLMHHLSMHACVGVEKWKPVDQFHWLKYVFSISSHQDLKLRHRANLSLAREELMLLVKDQQKAVECVQWYNNGNIHPLWIFNIPTV